MVAPKPVVMASDTERVVRDSWAPWRRRITLIHVYSRILFIHAKCTPEITQRDAPGRGWLAATEAAGPPNTRPTQFCSRGVALIRPACCYFFVGSKLELAIAESSISSRNLFPAGKVRSTTWGESHSHTQLFKMWLDCRSK